MRTGFIIPSFRIACAAAALTAFGAEAARAGVAAPSFDCAKASRAVDKLICADGDLAREDARLAQKYRAALAGTATEQDRTALRIGQRDWIVRRDKDCMRAAAGATRCLRDAYAQRLAVLGGPQTAPVGMHEKTTEFDDTALNAAHPRERAEIGFPQGAFSPEGDLFAFTVSQLVSGDSDQVWLYRLGDRRLIAATPPPVKEKSDVSIEGLFWAGDTLYVQGTSGPYGGAQEPFHRAVTMDGGRDVPAVPAPVAVPGEARDTTAEAGDELSDQGDKREEDGRYVITSRNHGHGSLTLAARGATEWTIATGSWNLAGFVFDAPRHRVIFPNGIEGLAIYDLDSRKTVATLHAPVNALLDVTHDGRLAAFSGNGACDPTAPPADHGRRQTICFIQLP